jgi:KaiC/GvpD/RAD55 family RecA-like ATPase
MAMERGLTERVEPRLFSGIEALDRVIGGFPTGSVIAITGRPGSGHEIFAQQIMFNAATAGNKVTYFSIDRPPEDIASELRSMKLDLDELIASQRWTFLNGFDVRLRIKQGELGSKVLLDMLNAVSKSAKAGDWTTVDTLSKILELHDQKEVTSFVDDLLVEAREGRGLHFLVMVEELHDQKTLASLAQAVDGYVRLKLDDTRSEPTGTIRIEKLRRANSIQRSLNYLIGSDGITIETATRIL